MHGMHERRHARDSANARSGPPSKIHGAYMRGAHFFSYPRSIARCAGRGRRQSTVRSAAIATGDERCENDDLVISRRRSAGRCEPPASIASNARRRVPQRIEWRAWLWTAAPAVPLLGVFSRLVGRLVLELNRSSGVFVRGCIG